MIEAGGSGPTDLCLEPWTPAILVGDGKSRVVGARDSGRTSLWIDQSPTQTIALDWELQPRSHPHGRSFRLALPGDETTILSLEVPRDWVPSSRQGRRRGPRPAAHPDANLWEIEAESGRIDLHLYDPDDKGESYVASNPWLTSQPRSTCEARRIASVGWPTGRPTGGSSSMPAISSEWRSSLIRGWN